MSTAAELLTIVGTTLQDATLVRWPRDEVLGYMNVALQEIARTMGHLRTSAVLAVDATQTPATAYFTMPADLLDLKRVECDGRRIDRVTQDCLGDLWEDVTGTPSNYMFGDDGPSLLRAYPAPTGAVVMRLAYVRRPALLVDDTDVPEVPEAYQMALVYYAVHRCYLKDLGEGNLSRSQVFRNMYDAEVAALLPRAARQFDASPRDLRADFI